MTSRIKQFRLRRSLLLVGMALFLVASSGCGGSAGALTGSVSYQGKKLKSGTVLFVAEEKGNESFNAQISEDGAYSIPRIVSGKYKVCVTTSAPSSANVGMPGGGGLKNVKNKNASDIPAMGSSPAAALKARNKANYVQIPDKYASPDSTDIVFEYSGGDKTFNIELK